MSNWHADKSKVGRETEPLVGRDEETGLLRRAWQSTKTEGLGQFIVLSDEAGIGKSALINMLRNDVRRDGMAWFNIRCSPFHTSSSLHPIIEHYKRLADWQPENDGPTRLAKLEAIIEPSGLPLSEAVPLLASLLSLSLPSEKYPPLQLNPQQHKHQLSDLIIAMTLAAAERQPLLAVWEDLHWADPSTLDLLTRLIDQVPTASLLMTLTSRSEFVPPWTARTHITPLTLNRLERPQAIALIGRIVGEKPLPDEVIEHIANKADGVPLYVEELTKTILASQIVLDTGAQLELTCLYHHWQFRILCRNP